MREEGARAGAAPGLLSRIRGRIAGSPALSDALARVAVAAAGNGFARRLLGSSEWDLAPADVSPPELAREAMGVALPGCPFGAAATADGRRVFVSLQRADSDDASVDGLAVLHRVGDAHRLSHVVPLAAPAWGSTLARGGSLLVVANSHGVVFVDVAAASEPGNDPILGVAHYGRDLYTAYVQASIDDRFVFASDEHNGTVSVLDLDLARDTGYGPEALVAQVPVDLAPVGMAPSPDGRLLYVACEMARVSAPDLVNWFVYAATWRGKLRRSGVVCVIDIEKAVACPRRAVVGRVRTGCHPVRVCLSRDGSVAWVTARGSHRLLAFETVRLSPSTAEEALLATVPVGSMPVGLALLEEDDLVLVANSNRADPELKDETLSLVDTRRALAGEPAVVGCVRVGSFPRELLVSPDQRWLYVSNFRSRSLGIVELDVLRRAKDLR